MMLLSTGRTVEEYAMPNGATHVEIVDGADINYAMTETEWLEYCAHVRALNLDQSRRRLRNRQAYENSKIGRPIQ